MHAFAGTSLISRYAPRAARGEWQLLIDAVAAQINRDPNAPGRDASALNWNIILRLAEAHRVVPLLASAVQAGRVINVPGDSADRLRDHFRGVARRGMDFAIELRQILAALKGAGIRCIPLKGPVLTVGSYGKLGLRDFDDLDLMIAPADVPSAVEIFVKLGYAGWDIPPRWIASHLITESEHNLVCDARRMTVDLHWAVGRKYFTMPWDFDALWRRSARVKLIGYDVPDMSADDAVLFLCYHGGKHLFGRLSWICDVAATLTAHPSLDWDALLQSADETGTRRLLLLGLGLCRDLLGTRIPERIDRRMRRDTNLRSLQAAVARGIFAGGKKASPVRQQIDASLFHLRVRERTSDRLRYLFWSAAPNARDWRNSSLPPQLSFLLALTRPVRLLRKS